MADPDRSAAELVALFGEIERAPQQFDFFQALRRVECAAAGYPRLAEGARAKDDPVRLGQEPTMAFAPRTLGSLARDAEGTPPRMEVFFFGLFGPNGPLPLHLTEYARNRLRQHDDPTFARFADVFHHRLLSLFYRAWANAQPTVQLDRPESDRFAACVGALIGLAGPAMRQRDSLPDRFKLHFAGRLSAGARHPEGLRAMIAEFFGLPVAIEEFVGRWTEIPEGYRCELGSGHQGTRARVPRVGGAAVLGVSSTIGQCVWDCQQTFRIVIGPVSLDDYRRLLPGGKGLQQLEDIVRNYLGDELMWELRLVLRKEQAPPIGLGQSGHLGLTAWLEPESLTADAADFHWNPQVDGDRPDET
jgi:type VI secretion system protein ImpH